MCQTLCVKISIIYIFLSEKLIINLKKAIPFFEMICYNAKVIESSAFLMPNKSKK